MFRFRNEGGFTLTEVILGLLITSVMVTVLMGTFAALLKGEELGQRDYSRAAELFFMQFKPYLLQSSGYSVSPDQRSLELVTIRSGSPEQSSFIHHNQRIVRQVNGQGYDIFLEQVISAYFEEVQGGIRLTVELSDGRDYSRQFRRPEHGGIGSEPE
ncbi:competence type IV pilus minor pilin ComGF [Alteribacter natronophilus]|uniref:competence type IV pilus minor pilin ComGF n=1 Tax=Alteribacter natronophilus TaxID=2583810 RepID=UPI00110EC716|nr:competence type IV pilus minor pilin ComGF [Alteribacter natronophilus]TMW73778.1 hypothetical protein FGB90_05690 [Alteribacter natronophilus]